MQLECVSSYLGISIYKVTQLVATWTILVTLDLSSSAAITAGFDLLVISSLALQTGSLDFRQCHACF